jgi:hypothetical protein
MGDAIEVGDTVTVNWSTHPPFTGEVLYVPAAQGDSWHIRSSGGSLLYVQQFDFMERHEHG